VSVIADGGTAATGTDSAYTIVVRPFVELGGDDVRLISLTGKWDYYADRCMMVATVVG